MAPKPQLTAEEMQTQAGPTQSPLLSSLHRGTEAAAGESHLGPALKESTSHARSAITQKPVTSPTGVQQGLEDRLLYQGPLLKGPKRHTRGRH